MQPYLWAHSGVCVCVGGGGGGCPHSVCSIVVLGGTYMFSLFSSIDFVYLVVSKVICVSNKVVFTC